MSAPATSETNFFLRHEFVIRRVHSLLGIVPLGLYMTVHLVTNASLLNGTATFQRAVFLIHSPGKLLPLIEWGLIFAPLVFHAVIGVWIAKSGKSNSSQYQFRSNRRYSWQRWTGIIALVYLFFHILHLHGWFHVRVWEALIRPLGFGAFRPYNAASSLVEAMAEWGPVWPAFYLVGVLACVYHLANGIWTSGITWGLWISPAAQARASKLCTGIGVVLAILGVSAWWAAVSPSQQDTVDMRADENRMYEAAVVSGMVSENDEKRSQPKIENDETSGSQ
ncbi:MAG: succinate dehydrogenase cytochrome b558 subunit [Rubripirellula sp.]|jgi:succinate dehydrogenase / fumarate reductase cytochrome b subunit|nr:succinate dehydrogenase cytochrome b558 subunit [Rubripirellula sp.]